MKTKVFTNKSINKLKKELKKGFNLWRGYNNSSILIETKDRNISLSKEIAFFPNEEVKTCEINWSSSGSVNLEKAKKFNKDFSEILRLADFIEKNFKTEMKDLE